MILLDPMAKPRTDHVLISIFAAESTKDAILKSILESPPENSDGKRGAYFVKEQQAGDMKRVVLTYLEFPVRPDIEGMIETWHREPSREGRMELWDAIRIHGEDLSDNRKFIRLDRLMYIATPTGELVIH